MNELKFNKSILLFNTFDVITVHAAFIQRRGIHLRIYKNVIGQTKR